MVGPRTPSSPISFKISRWKTGLKKQKHFLWLNTKQEKRSYVREWAEVQADVRTFVPVGHQDAWHELLLTVGVEGISDHDLLLRQQTLQVQGITPVKLREDTEEHSTVRTTSEELTQSHKPIYSINWRRKVCSLVRHFSNFEHWCTNCSLKVNYWQKTSLVNHSSAVDVHKTLVGWMLGNHNLHICANLC